MSFFSTVLPVILRREEFPLDVIGMLQLIKLPWIFKFVWAPTIDQAIQNMRSNRRMILLFELLYALTICVVAFLNLHVDFTLIVALMVIAIGFSASQDIATDALAAKILNSGSLSLGNGIQSAGSFIGALVGSGVLLVAYTYIGWKYVMVLLACVVLLAIVPMIIFSKKMNFPARKKTRVNYMGMFSFFKGKFNYSLFLFFSYSGIIGLLAMMKPFMVDRGFSNEEIGFIAGILGPATATLCSILTGMFMRKVSFTKSLQLFILFQLGGVSLFALANTLDQNWLYYIAIIMVWCAYSSTSVAIYTMAMSKVRNGYEGTDFSTQIILTHLSGIIMAIIGGKVARYFGYEMLFALEIVLGTCVFVWTFFLRRTFESSLQSPIKK